MRTSPSALDLRSRRLLAGVGPLLALFVALPGLGCKRKSQPQLAPAPNAAQSATPARGPAAPEANPAEARAFVDAWLAAQNRGDFPAYRALYAEKLLGVRRSGPRVRRFAREGWLKDRERMFRKPMTVSLDELRVERLGAAWQVHGRQTWASESYKDVGPKRLLLVNEAGAWRIAQEEMLGSQTEPVSSSSSRSYLLVADGHAVLSTEPDRSWGDGHRVLGATRRDATEGVLSTALPPHLAEWKGEAVVLLDAKGETCTARVVGFRLWAGATWHFGMNELFDGPDADVGAIQAQVWTNGKVLLVAQLGPREGRCEDPVVVLRGDAAPEDVVAFARAGQAAAEEAEQRMHDLLIRRYKNESELAGVTSVSRAALADGSSLVVLAHTPESCTSETGSAESTLLWTVRGAPNAEYTLLGEDPTSGTRTPVLGLDLDGDGVREIVFTGAYGERVGVYKLAGQALKAVDRVEVPFYDCGC